MRTRAPNSSGAAAAASAALLLDVEEEGSDDEQARSGSYSRRAEEKALLRGVGRGRWDKDTTAWSDDGEDDGIPLVLFRPVLCQKSVLVLLEFRPLHHAVVVSSIDVTFGSDTPCQHTLYTNI
jgi:hypothetical protein